jgi:hypothetical protein
MRRATKSLPKTNTTASAADSAYRAPRSTHLTNVQADCNGEAQSETLLSLLKEKTVRALTKFFNRLAVYNLAAGQQCKLPFQQRRERFRITHDSNTPPHELLAPPPRPLRCNVPFLGFSFMLVSAVFLYVNLISGSFQTIETREIEARTWVQKLTAKSPVTDRDVRYQRVAREVDDLESHSARELRRIMLLAAIVGASFAMITPLLMSCFFLQIHCLLRSGIVARAKVVSHNRWRSVARLSFTTTDGKQVETLGSAGPWVSPGMDVWILYSSRHPKRAWVYNSDGDFSKLLSK